VVEVSPQTEVIDMRAPATAPIPVIQADPTWDALVRPRRARRHPRRVAGRNRVDVVGQLIQAAAYAVLAGWIGVLAAQGELVAQGLPWAP
jgi:hypothetical protein